MYKRVCDAPDCNNEQETNRYMDVKDRSSNTWLEISRREQTEYNDETEEEDIIVEEVNLVVCSPTCGIIVMEGLQ